MNCARCGLDRDRYKGQSYCKQCSKVLQSVWAKANRKRKAAHALAWRRRNMDRRRIMQRCSNAFWTAIRNGEIKLGKVCTFCQSTENIEGAHTDYSKPLDVIWLCRKCHRQWDAVYPKTRPAKALAA